MRKNGIKLLFPTLFFCLFSVQCFSQTLSNQSVNWLSPVTIMDSTGNSRIVPAFEGARYFPAYQYLPVLTIRINDPVESFSLENPIYSPVTEEEAKLLGSIDTKNLKHNHISVLSEKNKPASLISFIPLRLSASGFEKLTSFSIAYTKGQFSQNKSFQKNSISSGYARINGASGSVLSTGNWYKVSISSSGIFKLDYNFFKNTLGINPSNIDPRQIRVFGNGGGMLSQANASFRYDDLVENPLLAVGESDGNFDNGDYFLFYGKGPDTWAYNSTEKIFNHTKNIYSDYAYYFITIGPTNGIRISTAATVSGAGQSLNTFDDRLLYEKESLNMLGSGREWYGEKFDFELSQNFNFSVPGVSTGSDIYVTAALMGHSTSASSFKIYLNNNLLGTQTFTNFDLSTFSDKGQNLRKVFTLNSSSINSNQLSVNLIYNKQGNSSAIGYLNYLEVNVKRDLKLYSNQNGFRSASSTAFAVSEYQLGNADGNTFIWDITEAVNPKNIQYNLSGNTAIFSYPSDTLYEFIAFTGNNFPYPGFINQIQNQNLHAIGNSNVPDLLIVTHPNLLSSAERLADFRRSANGMNVEVVTVDQVYNEFSSGAQDLTAIRDFVRMVYKKGTATDTLAYLLLFGSGSYDYKDRIPGNNNLVPIYESINSLNPINSFSSDDYFGFLDDSEGAWPESPAIDYMMDVGIGRIVASNISEADGIVNKIINYQNNLATMGKWKNRITLVSDDSDGNLHLTSADKLATLIGKNYPTANINKIFLDAYPQIPTPSGEVCPVVNDGIDQAIDKGTFLINYTGHGGELGWAQEGILNLQMINNWTNFNRLPFMVTATCEFGRYDDPARPSGAEFALINPNGGTIGLLTSTRPVYSHSNDLINSSFYNSIFDKVNNEFLCMGEIMRLTKNGALFGINNRNYALLGDPSMKLAFPEESIVVTKINDSTVTSIADTLKALQKITIEGEVRVGNIIANDFNGTLYATVYDKETSIKTLNAPVVSFKVRNQFIYEGEATVANGKFKFSFVVPKDIAYQYDFGKISLYAQKDNVLRDASGYDSNVIIGGSSSNATADNAPPQIRLFLNDESFVNGGLSGQKPILIANLADDNGINIAGTGIGHEISLVIDNGEVIVLNEFYTASKDDYKKGKVTYSMKELAPGTHTLKLKAWDTYNNSAEATLEFVIANNEKMALSHILNYPNPFSSHTVFHFDHNRSGDDIEVLIQIYTVSGKLIKTLRSDYFLSSGHIGDISWDGRDDYGDKIGKGVYVYKVSVKSRRDGSHNHKYEKLVILN